jgi:hypothetical protein
VTSGEDTPDIPMPLRARRALPPVRPRSEDDFEAMGLWGLWGLHSPLSRCRGA